MMNLLAKIWRLLPYFVRMRFVRMTQTKFTVSVVAIVLNEANEVLVLDHYIRPGATWGLPGGFIDTGEYPDKAILRELKEETDLDLVDLQLLRVRTINRHVEMLFSSRADGSVKLKSSEIRDYGWFSEPELPEGVSKVQRKLISEALQALESPPA